MPDVHLGPGAVWSSRDGSGQCLVVAAIHPGRHDQRASRRISGVSPQSASDGRLHPGRVPVGVGCGLPAAASTAPDSHGGRRSGLAGRPSSGAGRAGGCRRRPPLDFEAMDLPTGSAVDVFRRELPRIVDMLQGRDLRQLHGDPALRACAERPVPVLSAAVSPAAARRAARCGAGILMEGMSAPDRLGPPGCRVRRSRRNRGQGAHSPGLAGRRPDRSRRGPTPGVRQLHGCWWACLRRRSDGRFARPRRPGRAARPGGGRVGR